MLRTPIKAPWNVVSMVCLESAILESPSLFTASIIQDPSNALVRLIDIDPDCDYSPVVDRFDYWNNDITTAHGIVYTNLQQNNTIPVKSVFVQTINTAMTDIDQVAKFLCHFTYETKAFRCYIGPYYLDEKKNITYVKLPGDIQPCFIE